jgi:hypothetical protein
MLLLSVALVKVMIKMATQSAPFHQNCAEMAPILKQEGNHGSFQVQQVRQHHRRSNAPGNLPVVQTEM